MSIMFLCFGNKQKGLKKKEEKEEDIIHYFESKLHSDTNESYKITVLLSPDRSMYKLGSPFLTQGTGPKKLGNHPCVTCSPDEPF